MVIETGPRRGVSTPKMAKMAEEKQEGTERDLLIANSVYPEAEPIFTFRLESLASIKDSCHVVLDTNALLVPYTIGKESLEQIRKTCENLAAQKRLVIPGQVAREFAKHRANKLGELYQQLSSKRDDVRSIQKGIYPLLEPLTQYQESLQLEVQINKVLSEYREALTKVLDHIRAWTWDDPVSLLYSELFAGEAVVDPSFDDADVLGDLDRRKRNSIPPGYKDAGVGDLLIWKTILKIGNLHKRSVLFVSGDEKADWYHQSNRQALYPRYELIDEFRRHSGGKSLHIVRFSDFLDLYGAGASVVEEVRKEEMQPLGEQTEEEALPACAWRAERAIHEFLKAEFSAENVTIPGGSFDFLVTSPGARNRNVVVKYGPSAHSFLILLQKDPTFRRLFEQSTLTAGQMVWVFLVGVKAEAAATLFDVAGKLSKRMHERLVFIAGYIGEHGEFVQVGISV